MNKRRLELLGFLFGVAATVACVFNGKEVTQQRNTAPADLTAQGLTSTLGPSVVFVLSS